MSEPLVRTTTSRGIARIVLNRPAKRNALSRDLLRQLRAAVDEAARDATVRLVILAAEGPAFCAGMDLGEMQSRAGRSDADAEWAEDTRIYRELLTAIFQLSVPTLAVVQGPALAGGLGLVLACDLGGLGLVLACDPVLASEAAVFALPEPKRGITAAVVLPLLLYRVGPAWSSNLLLSGESWPASLALRTGLCQEVVPADGLAARAESLAASILTGARSSLAVTKKHLQDCAAADLARQLDAGMKHSAEARAKPEAREGLAAFLEKRSPAWAPAATDNRGP
jgi:methylglutaconyl-CoA hydratase